MGLRLNTLSLMPRCPRHRRKERPGPAGKGAGLPRAFTSQFLRLLLHPSQATVTGKKREVVAS